MSDWRGALALGWHALVAGVSIALGLFTLWAYAPERDDWDRLGFGLLLGPTYGILGMIWLIMLVASAAVTRKLPARRWLAAPAIFGATLFVGAMRDLLVYLELSH